MRERSLIQTVLSSRLHWESPMSYWHCIDQTALTLKTFGVELAICGKKLMPFWRINKKTIEWQESCWIMSCKHRFKTIRNCSLPCTLKTEILWTNYQNWLLTKVKLLCAPSKGVCLKDPGDNRLGPCGSRWWSDGICGEPLPSKSIVMHRHWLH